MSTAQPERSPESDEEAQKPSRLLLVKWSAALTDEPAPVEPDEDQEQDGEPEGEEEEAPDLLVRLRLTVWEHIQDVGGWTRVQIREILGVLDIRGFISDTIADVAVSSGYIPRALGHWVAEPDPRTEDDAWKKMGIRAAVVGAPVTLAVYLVMRPGGSRLMWAYTAGWIVACWITADSARLDAKLRKKAKKRKAKDAAKAKRVKLAKRHGLDAADLEDVSKKKKKGIRDKDEVNRETSREQGCTSQVTSPENDHETVGEQPATSQYTPEQLRSLAIVWVRDAIGEKNGIHLEPLWNKAKKDGACKPDTPRPEFRKALEHHGIKFDQVKVSGCCGKVKGHNRTGVKLADVPPVPKASPGDPHWRPHASVTRYQQEHQD